MGPNLNFALSITSSLPYAGCILDAWVTPQIFSKANEDFPDDKPEYFGFSFWMGFLFNCIGFTLIIILCVIDRRAERNLEKMKRAWNRISADVDATNVVVLEKPKFNFSDVKNFGTIYWINCLSCALQKTATFGYIMWIPIHFYKRY